MNSHGATPFAHATHPEGRNITSGKPGFRSWSVFFAGTCFNKTDQASWRSNFRWRAEARPHMDQVVGPGFSPDGSDK